MRDGDGGRAVAHAGREARALQHLVDLEAVIDEAVVHKPLRLAAKKAREAEKGGIVDELGERGQLGRPNLRREWRS